MFNEQEDYSIHENTIAPKGTDCALSLTQPGVGTLICTVVQPDKQWEAGYISGTSLTATGHIVTSDITVNKPFV